MTSAQKNATIKHCVVIDVPLREISVFATNNKGAVLFEYKSSH